MLHRLSTRAELLSYGVQHYCIRSEETSTLVLQLYQRYRQEGLTMPDILEEFVRETIASLLKELPDEKRQEGLSLEELLKGIRSKKHQDGLSPEERIKGIPRETIESLLKELPVEKRLEGLSPEERIKGIPRKTLEELLQKMKDNGSPPGPPRPAPSSPRGAVPATNRTVDR